MLGAEIEGKAGGLGAEPVGGFGADGALEVSESEIYDDSRDAPVSIPPPRFFNLGIPPANIPPSCGAAAIPPASPPATAPSSLLLRARFPPPSPVGARLPGGFSIPGTGGAPPTGGAAEPPAFESTMGADRSLVTAFFRRAPLEMSESNAP